MTLATSLFFVAQAYKPQFVPGALVTFVASVCAMFIAISVSHKNRLNEQREEFQKVLKEVSRWSNNVLQGGRLDSIDELFEYLCEARSRTARTIRLMKVRGASPVRITDGEVNVKERKGGLDIPEYASRSQFMKQWYDGLPTWAATNGHQIERITVLREDMGIYAAFVEKQLAAINATWTSYILNDEVSGLPAYNLYIFDDNELTITFGNPNQESSTTIWLNEKGIAGFFVKHFDLIKTQYASEYSRRIPDNSVSPAG